MTKASEESSDLSRQETDYASQRLSPVAGQTFYLVLSDLLLALDEIATNQRLTILDYGADRAPYRPLFPNSDYRCADIGGAGTKDYLIGEDGKVAERDEFFDLVLSTQVAEHVTCPDVYLAECFRLLRPGGRLFLSTHGSFEDHAFPYDFRRWTAEGLKRDIRRAGFEIALAYKLTTGPRATLHHIERCLETTFVSPKTMLGMTMRALRVIARMLRPLVHRLADRFFCDYRLIPVNDPSREPQDVTHNVYIVVAVVARRPEKMN